MHDYRFDQWNDTFNTKQVTEIQRIPNESPYTIILNEVPVKTSPTSITVKKYEASTETAGDSFAEVAATPSENEFYPDYFTKADGDDNWNTGTLLFNENNALQTVQITYTAKGTLNSVLSPRRPSFWTERGDGSDGALYATSDMTLSGLKQYTNVYIKAGVTITVDGFLDIRCQGDFQNYGTINATGGGGRGGYGLCGDDNGGGGTWLGLRGEKAICGGYGGAGYKSDGSSGVGVGNITCSSLTESLKKYALYNNIICNGGGGSNSGAFGSSDEGDYSSIGDYDGGNGGGFIRIIAKSHYSSGTYISNGKNGKSSNYGSFAFEGGGGGGGVIIVIAERNLASGSFEHTGGSGYANGGGGWHEVIEIGGEY